MHNTMTITRLAQRRSVLLFAAAIWISVVVGGLAWLGGKANTPGKASTPPSQWPAATTVRLDAGRATLVMFLHPYCPCSRATIEELNGLMAHCNGKITVYALFLKPKGVTDAWVHTDLWRSAEAIPGVHAIADDGGLEAQRFGAKTSGQTFLYGLKGNLLFRGGITAARGHSGDNAGRDAIQALLVGGSSRRNVTTPVFGCSLL
jgi:hypothetical protein